MFCSARAQRYAEYETVKLEAQFTPLLLGDFDQIWEVEFYPKVRHAVADDGLVARY